MKTRIIAFANHKGGVGKTTSTACVGTILAHKGYKVLLVDMDSQANLTHSLMSDTPSRCSYYALTGKDKELPICSVSEGLDIIPSSVKLSNAEQEMQAAIGRESILAELLSPIKKRYDYILIDCCPGIGLMVLNALTVADDVIIPMLPESLAKDGLLTTVKLINTVRRKLNSKLHFLGVLFTRWEVTNNSKQILEAVTTECDSKVFVTKIRKNVKVAEAPGESKNLIDYAPRSNGAKDYLAFTDELLATMEG